jgi:hypothetical protein
LVKEWLHRFCWSESEENKIDDKEEIGKQPVATLSAFQRDLKGTLRGLLENFKAPLKNPE